MRFPGSWRSDATSPKERAIGRPKVRRRYAEADRKGRGERAMSSTEIAAMLIASFRRRRRGAHGLLRGTRSVGTA
jgi:hypothetical protein